MIGPILKKIQGNEKWREGIFLFFSLFPMCSHHVPKRFPRVAQYICNSTSYLSHVVCKPKVIHTQNACCCCWILFMDFFFVVFNLQPFFFTGQISPKSKNSKIQKFKMKWVLRFLVTEKWKKRKRKKRERLTIPNSYIWFSFCVAKNIER